MENLAAMLLTTIATLFVVLTGAVVIFLGAVWFGLFIVAPRIGRALDRAETDDEESGDQPS
jgi:hypothetical protein